MQFGKYGVFAFADALDAGQCAELARRIEALGRLRLEISLLSILGINLSFLLWSQIFSLSSVCSITLRLELGSFGLDITLLSILCINLCLLFGCQIISFSSMSGVALSLEFGCISLKISFLGILGINLSLFLGCQVEVHQLPRRATVRS